MDALLQCMVQELQHKCLSPDMTVARPSPAAFRRFCLDERIAVFRRERELREMHERHAAEGGEPEDAPPGEHPGPPSAKGMGSFLDITAERAQAHGEPTAVHFHIAPSLAIPLPFPVFHI